MDRWSAHHAITSLTLFFDITWMICSFFIILLFSYGIELTFLTVRSAINFTVLLKQKKQDINNAAASAKALDDELTCSVCLEQVNVGELIRSLPCLHQVILLIFFLVFSHFQVLF